MNIALFSDSYLPTKSGVVTVVVQLRKILTELGHHVVVVTVCPHGGAQPEEADPDMLRVHSIPAPFGDNQYIGFPHKRAVVAFLREHGVQIIHSHTEFYIAHAARRAGKALRIPVIATTHTMWEDFYKYYLMGGRLIPVRVIRKIVQRLYSRFYALINVSQKAHDYFTMPAMLPRMPSAVIPNAIDTASFLARGGTEEALFALRRSLAIREDEVTLVFVGRVAEEKRVEELFDVAVRVLEQRPNVKMLFVGAGGASYELERAAHRLRMEQRILFTGFISWESLALYYRLGDIFVTASLSEMHSMTALEALVSGLPVVCRRDESFFDTVFDGKNGYMADSDEAMVGRILDLVDSPERRAAFAAHSREVARRFSLRTHGLRTVAFYEAVLAHYPQAVSAADLRAAVDAVRGEEDRTEVPE